MRHATLRHASGHSQPGPAAATNQRAIRNTCLTHIAPPAPPCPSLPLPTPLCPSSPPAALPSMCKAVPAKTVMGFLNELYSKCG